MCVSEIQISVPFREFDYSTEVKACIFNSFTTLLGLIHLTLNIFGFTNIS